MVGGIVSGIAKGVGRSVVNVAGVRGEEGRETTIHVKEVDTRGKIPVNIQPGDKIWWQSGHAYWTPQSHVSDGSNRGGGVLYDIQIPKATSLMAS